MFLVGVDDLTLPSPWAIRRAAHDDDPRALEEEKRLLYVAVTRAQERLDVVHAVYGRRAVVRPSRFLTHPMVQAAMSLPGEDPIAATAPEAAPAVATDALLAALAGEDDL